MNGKEQVYLGIDVGAESGRVMAGLWDGERIRLEELHRFANSGVSVAGSLRWDVLRLWSEMQHGLTLAAKRFGDKIVSVGVDTWGVDYVLLSNSSEILGHPHHYRDSRTRGMLKQAFDIVPRAEIFDATGLQFMEINTLFQLLAMQRTHPELFWVADCLLLMPDYFHWCLSGFRGVEFTNATTTQCFHPTERQWSFDMLQKFGLPAKMFPQIVPPGTTLGLLRESVAEKTGLRRINVVAPATHDTASAVAAVPTDQTGKANWAYISSGTWSLMGVELPGALLSQRVLELNMTNEGGIDGTYRLLKNIMGLWLVQQCKRAFTERGGNFDYAELARLAAAAPAFRSLIDPDDGRFMNPPDMTVAIQQYCRETHQPLPESEGQFIRCVYESLALKYATVLHSLEELTGTRIEVIHVVGGGSQSQLLNTFTANACGRPVIAGPAEATVMGNLLVQVRSAGELKSLGDIRAVVRASSELQSFDPVDQAGWVEARQRFARLLQRAS